MSMDSEVTITYLATNMQALGGSMAWALSLVTGTPARSRRGLKAAPARTIRTISEDKLNG